MYRIFCFIVFALILAATGIQAAELAPALEAGFGAEGGENCRHDDPGNKRPDGTWGCTEWGISPKSYGYHVPSNVEGAAAIYGADYWEPLHLGDLNSQIIANAIFLACINQGEPLWAKYIQIAINLSNDYGEDIAVDGKIGPKTIAAANQCDPVELYVNIIILQGSRYQAIVKAKPAMRGWYKDLMYRMRNGVRMAVHEYDAYLERRGK